MTEKQKQAYVDLLDIVQDDTQFLAGLTQLISVHVTKVKEKVEKIKHNLEEQ